MKVKFYLILMMAGKLSPNRFNCMNNKSNIYSYLGVRVLSTWRYIWSDAEPGMELSYTRPDLCKGGKFTHVDKNFNSSICVVGWWRTWECTVTIISTSWLCLVVVRVLYYSMRCTVHVMRWKEKSLSTF